MRIIRDLFWIALIIITPIMIFDTFFEPYCKTLVKAGVKNDI